MENDLLVTRRKRRLKYGIKYLCVLVFALCLFIVFYIYTNPLIFNESFWEHSHCINVAMVALDTFAAKHNGKFPFHPKGYGNALLLLNEEDLFALTGPGYDTTAIVDAKRNEKELSEDGWGRVYVQGLNQKSHGQIALLFDKSSTPGGDHCHFFNRIWAPLGREVLFVDNSFKFIEDSNWQEFCKIQVNLLTQEGFNHEEALRIFGQTK